MTKNAAPVSSGCARVRGTCRDCRSIVSPRDHDVTTHPRLPAVAPPYRSGNSNLRALLGQIWHLLYQGMQAGIHGIGEE